MARQASKRPRKEALRRPDPECVAVLNRAMDEIEALLRAKLASASPRTLAKELSALRTLMNERLQAMKTQRAPQPAPPSPEELRLQQEAERAAALQQTYESFIRENPGKAHFTRKQWERARLVELAGNDA